MRRSFAASGSKMYPLLFGVIPVYFLMWGIAAVVCVGLGTRMAVRAGFPERTAGCPHPVRDRDSTQPAPPQQHEATFFTR
jgi:hypothetical protein